MDGGWDPRYIAQAYDVSAMERILNSHPVPPRASQHDCWIAVRARLVWERSGEETIATIAYAWTSSRVLVQVLDRRRPLTNGVWLAPCDVERI